MPFLTALVPSERACRERGHRHKSLLHVGRRHFAASAMIETGLPLPDVASLLGHAKFDLTLQVYAHPIIRGARRQEALDCMATKLVEAPFTIDVEGLVSLST